MISLHNPTSEDELIASIKAELFTAVIGDIMDKLGFLNQFLPPQVQPLRNDMVIVGKAMPVLEADVTESADRGNNPILQKPFGLMLEALDDLKKNEVYICTGSAPSYALWGELMSMRAIKLGASGAVVNGYSRDTNGILALNFPVFSYGSYAKDQAPRGKVIDFRTSIEMNGVLIRNGDYVIGDRDGVCIVPKDASAEIFRLAFEKARGEKVVFQKIKEGMSAKTAFETYGIM
ncbi:Regulator of RNase E activity RraA [Pedobacter steynii]|uniref:Regulator of RNase E activity RraA n=1 Tax=Pedobacter steynii TaxID=430522 RepID=A0A1G9R9W1_9SPHI|nr:RraA family protein [Pedobacter steynii]NQX37823.1 RraA family protein [Pedobacter steynii]SDM20046.1 Regulator of RNase E activity RraA [Pedobacter steynii]